MLYLALAAELHHLVQKMYDHTHDPCQTHPSTKTDVWVEMLMDAQFASLFPSSAVRRFRPEKPVSMRMWRCTR